MTFDLGVAAAQGGEAREREQFPVGQADPGAGEVVAEAVAGQEPLETSISSGSVPPAAQPGEGRVVGVPGEPPSPAAGLEMRQPDLLEGALVGEGPTSGGRAGPAESSEPVAAPQGLMLGGAAGETPVGLLAHPRGPGHQFAGVVALDQLARRPPLVSGRDGVGDQEPPSIVRVDFKTWPPGLVELPAGRPDLHGRDGHGEQLTALGVLQREGAVSEIEDAAMAERRPPAHDVHD
jgi:hypothetical protein